MVVYQSCSLHEGIADCGTNKLETPRFEFPTHGSGLLCLSRYFRKILESILYCFAFYELPNECVKGAEFFLNFENLLGVCYGR